MYRNSSLRCPEIVIIKLRSCTENDMYRKCAVMEMYLIRPNPMLIPAGRSSLIYYRSSLNIKHNKQA